MRLHDYINIAFDGNSSRFARKLKATASETHCWATGKRPVPIKRCVQIEKLTGGAVTRKDLRPHDYHEIWTDIDDKETYDE